TVTNVTAPTTSVNDYTFDLANKSCRYIGIKLANHDEQTHLTVAYAVKHAVRMEGDKAVFFFPPLHVTTYAKDSATPNLKITMPGDITATACSESYAEDTPCKISDGSGQISGSTVTFRGYNFSGGWFEVQTSRSAMPNAHPVYISTTKQKVGFALLGLLTAAALARAGFGMWSRSQRTRADRNIRALPPELPVLAGAELAASNNPDRATMAALVELNLDNIIHVGMDYPVTLSPNDGSADAPGLEGIAYGVASTFMDDNVKHRSAALGKISCAVKEELEKEHLVRGFLLPKRERSLWDYLFFGALAVGDIALCVAAIFSTSIVPGVAAAVVLVLIATLIVVRNRRYAIQPITAEAKTYRTQIEGFAHFLSSDTLADLEETITEELYTQGLPWAVYLDHEEQWISKCLVAAASRNLEYSNWPFASSTEIQWNTFANFVKGKAQKSPKVAKKSSTAVQGSAVAGEAIEHEGADTGSVTFEQPAWSDPEQK
ncbi:MAG: DUF2207 family protein, partial [Propionibacteriaceae bacterium]